MKLAIFGDSFGYQHKSSPFTGWVDMLSHEHEVDNFCQCGVSQYKILQQIKSARLSLYDKIIVTHTSPTRVFVRHNPLHQDSLTHKNCDLLFADVEPRNEKFAKVSQDYFKYIFDLDYAIDIHNMICEKINFLLRDLDVIHITHFDYEQCYKFNDMINFYSLWTQNQGPVNHYNEKGNHEIYKILSQRIVHDKNIQSTKFI